MLACKNSDAPGVANANIASWEMDRESTIGDVTCDEDFMYNADDTPQVTCDRETDQWTTSMDGECQQRIWRTNVVSIGF